MDIVRAVGREDVGLNLPWLFTVIPNVILGLMFVFWCTAFILVIVLYPDNSKSEFSEITATLTALWHFLDFKITYKLKIKKNGGPSSD